MPLAESLEMPDATRDTKNMISCLSISTLLNDISTVPRDDMKDAHIADARGGSPSKV